MFSEACVSHSVHRGSASEEGGSLPPNGGLSPKVGRSASRGCGGGSSF